MSYQTQMPFIFVIFFSDIGQCFCPAQTKSLKNHKSGHVRIIQDNILLVNILGFYISWCKLQTTDDNRQNSKIFDQKCKCKLLDTRLLCIALYYKIISRYDRQIINIKNITHYNIQFQYHYKIVNHFLHFCFDSLFRFCFILHGISCFCYNPPQ